MSPSTDNTPDSRSDQSDVGRTCEPEQRDSSERKGTGVLAVIQSVAAAMIGVQSSKNKERDFTHGKPLHFIIGGLIGTLLFLLCIWLLVRFLIATS